MRAVRAAQVTEQAKINFLFAAKSAYLFNNTSITYRKAHSFYRLGKSATIQW
jgi:hypothetical protein